MNDSNQNLFNTSDLYFAAYLKVAGIPLVGTDKQGSRVFFQFEDPGSSILRDLKDQFFMDQARVPALSYSQALKALKNLIFTTGS